MTDQALTERKQSMPTTGTDLYANYEMVEQIATSISKARTAIPAFLRNNHGDCLAVSMQAFQWRMSPFFVAQESYLVQEGAMLAYGAKLYSAVINTNAPIVGRPRYQFFGNWDKIQGQIEIKKSQKGKNYAAPKWKPEDEVGVGVKVTVKVKGEDEPIVMDALLSGCYPRNSTNWSNNPQQQICYWAIRALARRHFPEVLGGTVCVDEIDDRIEKDITPKSVEDLDAGEAPSHVKESVVNKKEEMPAAKTGGVDVEKKSKPYLDRILKALSLQQMESIFKAIKSEPKAVKDACWPAYKEKLAIVQAEADKEVVDKQTGEVTQPNDGDSTVTPEQIMSIIDTADGVDTIHEALDLAGMHLDKRTKDYKEIEDRASIRVGELDDANQ